MAWFCNEYGNLVPPAAGCCLDVNVMSAEDELCRRHALARCATFFQYTELHTLRQEILSKISDAATLAGLNIQKHFAGSFSFSVC